MATVKAEMNALAGYLPEGAYPLVFQFIQQYKVHLTITRPRKSVLGDYRNATHQHNHRISVNGNLNQYAFLITLLHEIAHLITFEQYGHRVQAHGKEWKRNFGLLLQQFIQRKFFPDDINTALLKSIDNPAASSCADIDLLKVLSKYDQKPEHICFVEELLENEVFVIRGGRVFRRGPQLRKRIKCEEIATGKTYLFSPVYEVKKVISHQ